MAEPIRVLYVADDAGALDRAGRLPDGRETVAETAGTAADALQRIEAGGVDCVVAEQRLPDASGIELLRAVRDGSPTLPFVLFTTAELEPIAEEAVRAGLTDYLHRDPGTDQRAALAERVAGALQRDPTPSIEETQERFRTIIEQSSDVVSIVDREGTFLYQSPSVRAVLGYDPETFVGKSVFEFVHPEDRERVRSEFYDAIENAGREPTVEYRFKHADGSWRIVESRGKNMFDDPVVEGLVVNTRDVTERRRRDQRMNVLNRTLRHDLRNAMNVVIGNAELLMREYGSDDRAETIRRTAADMLGLGNKVRDVERALDTAEDPREMVDVVSVLEELVAAVERSEPQVTVEADLPESEWVLANRQIDSAFDDAIENAIEHNDSDDPRLRIGVEDARLAGEDAVTVTVADNGPGIPEEEIAVITGGGESPLEHTSGLGLWLIRWIVNESAGDVAFEESEMGGTAVRITLKKASVEQTIDAF